VIQEYWVFNLAQQELNVFRDVQGGNYQVELTWSRPTINLEAFPDLMLETAVLRELAFQDE
jgi:Uma2 family endonuclease